MLLTSLLAVTIVAGVALALLSSTGRGGESPRDARGAPLRPADAVPAALARNLEDADRIVGEGQGALEERLAELDGYPVVVNQWASWCTSCRFEFPFFREAVERYGDRVAFLGLDSQDELGAAERFLDELPGGFPSIFDPDASVAASLGGGQSWPTTIFLDEKGDHLHTKVGAYASEELLQQDIRRYALGQRG